jgi:hypothetical protein
VKSRSRALLLALVVIAFAPPFGVAQYTPKWRVGDRWVTRTFEDSPTGWGRTWRYTRYDVLRMAKVGGHSCFLLITRTADRYGDGGNDTVFSFVRADSWLVVREEVTLGRRPHAVRNAPHGRFGLDEMGSLRIPEFPLRLGDADTSFKLLKSDDDGFAELREITSLADPATVKQLLDDGDTVSVTGCFAELKDYSARVRALWPTGAVYQVRKEIGGDLGTDNSRIGQSLQFWSNDQPWRVYEERVLLDGLKPVRRVYSRTWLIASGHVQK